jgi:hypothetical protein
LADPRARPCNAASPPMASIITPRPNPCPSFLASPHERTQNVLDARPCATKRLNQPRIHLTRAPAHQKDTSNHRTSTQGCGAKAHRVLSLCFYIHGAGPEVAAEAQAHKLHFCGIRPVKWDLGAGVHAGDVQRGGALPTDLRSPSRCRVGRGSERGTGVVVGSQGSARGTGRLQLVGARSV